MNNNSISENQSGRLQDNVPPQGITLAARNVLLDCDRAVSAYSALVSGTTLRVGWVAVVTLLRAVGHVLSAIDAKTSPVFKRVIGREWKTLLNERVANPIFWEFIHAERNRVVKLYSFGFDRVITTRPPLGRAGFELTFELLSAQGSSPITTSGDGSIETISTIKEGRFKGRSELDLARDAVAWWDIYLTNIETNIIAEIEGENSVRTS